MWDKWLTTNYIPDFVLWNCNLLPNSFKGEELLVKLKTKLYAYIFLHFHAYNVFNIK